MAILSLEELDSLDFPIFPGDRIYLFGDLGSGKTTLTGNFIRKLANTQAAIKSPTYVYYRAYEPNIVHFDLYRIEDYDTFVATGGEEIFEDPKTICFVEWPEILESRYQPTVRIRCAKTEDEKKRSIEIERISLPR